MTLHRRHQPRTIACPDPAARPRGRMTWVARRHDLTGASVVRRWRVAVARPWLFRSHARCAIHAFPPDSRAKNIPATV
ncbi:hypothetical protein Q4610_02030 [Sphingobium sp. HBC34]|uniref:Uncharacterized protein n=1 Tax=Sphingobium cyanobacteriorum TaxID=3063954 RepID=A0ABT8ZI39_9SPHN|nr:hypothetical protein [Sphingobium sp. HBC34]MDO7833813.1 hypothetical protein [Sphingobium sp. HBC34]